MTEEKKEGEGGKNLWGVEVSDVELRTGRMAVALVALSCLLAILDWLGYFTIPLWGILAPIWAPFIVALILSAIFGLWAKFTK